jgi:hypothetical protein
MQELDTEILQALLHLLYGDGPLKLSVAFSDRNALNAFNNFLKKWSLDKAVVSFSTECPDKAWRLEEMLEVWHRDFDRDSDYHSDMHSSFYLTLGERPLLSDFLHTYISAFETGNLDSLHSGKNYFSYTNHIAQVRDLWEEEFTESGPQITCSAHDAEEKLKSYKMSKLRFYELILSLKKNGYLDIVNCTYLTLTFSGQDGFPDYRQCLFITIKFKKSPKEISDIFGYWLYYGDLRLNEKDGLAYYKGNRYPSVGTKGKAFSLLCLLIKNPGTKKLITELFDTIAPGEVALKPQTKKDRLEDWIKEIKNNLGLTKDKKPSITITTVKNAALLITNPP